MLLTLFQSLHTSIRIMADLRIYPAYLTTPLPHVSLYQFLYGASRRFATDHCSSCSEHHPRHNTSDRVQCTYFLDTIWWSTNTTSSVGRDYSSPRVLEWLVRRRWHEQCYRLYARNNRRAKRHHRRVIWRRQWSTRRLQWLRFLDSYVSSIQSGRATHPKWSSSQSDRYIRKLHRFCGNIQ